MSKKWKTVLTDNPLNLICEKDNKLCDDECGDSSPNKEVFRISKINHSERDNSSQFRVQFNLNNYDF